MRRLAIGDKLKAALLPRAVPSMLQWAAENIVIPDGPHKGERFDPDTQPFARLFFQEVDSGRWDRIVATGPTQTGKSLVCYIVPTLYHLFAVGETVVAGLPTIDMADDKWSQDFLPVIEASPALRRLLPATGPGSRAGRVKARVKFRNGATLRFLSGGGSDKSRAGFTGRVLAVTEVDGLDAAGRTSKEADKLKQMEARQRAFLQAGTRTYLECTVTTTAGRIWQEYIHGTESRIARPCPRCGVYVTPEREHLTGWQDAEDELQARANAAWTCPACSAQWTEAERHAANLAAVLVHRGQEVTPDGQVVGPVPPTRTLGFRWTAADNHFASAADVAADEFHGQREPDRDNAEKELRQFVHCLPWDPPEVEFTPLQPEAVLQRAGTCKKGIVPTGAAVVTVGIDTGKKVLHWVAIAWTPAGGGYIIDYGTQNTDAERLGIQRGLVEALRTLRGYLDPGWQTDNGQKLTASQVWIDSGYHEHADPVFMFCREANGNRQVGGELWRPSKGYGTNQRRMEKNYHAPRRTGNEVCYIGNAYHLVRDARWRMLVAHVNSDHWKGELHQRLALPPDAEQALQLYEVADAADHRELAEQLTAEREVTKYVDGRGEVICWERIRRANHFLDAAYLATAAGNLALTFHTQKASPVKTLPVSKGETVGGWYDAQRQHRGLDGRPWLASNR